MCIRRRKKFKKYIYKKIKNKLHKHVRCFYFGVGTKHKNNRQRVFVLLLYKYLPGNSRTDRKGGRDGF